MTRPHRWSTAFPTHAQHVFLVPAGETFYIQNSDGILHNVHTRSELNRPINKAQPKFLKRLAMRFDYPEIIQLECDAHHWMAGRIVVAANPYYATTDARGRFSLEDVPPGTYTLQVWHEKLGTRTQKVTVPAEAEVRIDIEYAQD